MWFWLSLAAMLCWSGSDLLSKLGSRPDDRSSHWKMTVAVGLVMGLHAAYEIFIVGTPISLDIIVRYLPASALYILSMVLGYVGLRYIELSISSPVCNASGAVAAILCFAFLGQRLGVGQAVSVALVCAGVIGLGLAELLENDEARALRREGANVRYARSFAALVFPLLYCFIDAAGTFADALILEGLDEASANVAYELTFLLMGVCAAIYVFGVRREHLTLPRELPKLAAGAFETAGQLAYVYALGANAVAAAPVISAYCAVSVLWSRIFLREKLSRWHYAAVAVTIFGIVLLGLFEEL